MPIMTRSRNMFVCNEDSAKRHAKCRDAARAIYNTGMTSPKTSELRPAVAAAAATCDTARCVQDSADIGGSSWRRPSSRSSRVQREAAVCISWMAGAKVEANLKGKKAQVKDITNDSRTTHAPESAGLKTWQIEGGGRG